MICGYRIKVLINYHNYIHIICKKHLHLSHLNLVRKPSSSRRITNTSFEGFNETTVFDVFPDPPKNENVCRNFYGVEGDEGVINIDELRQSTKPVQALQRTTSQKPLDEYRSYNFGAIRLDNENKPSYAPRRSVKLKSTDKKVINSQEENGEQSEDRGNVKNEINEPYQLNTYQNIPDVLFTKPTSLDSKEKKFPNYDRLQQSVTMSGTNSLPKTSVHAINKDTADNYLYNDSSVTKPCEQNQSATHESPKVTENFIDRFYFTESGSGDIVSQTEKSSNHFDKEQSFREEKSSSVHNLKKDAADSLISNNSHNAVSKQNQSDSQKVSESFIDDYYFAENYAENTVSQRENNFIEEQYFKESSLNVLKTNYEAISVNPTNPENLTGDLVTHNKKSYGLSENILKSYQMENRLDNHENNVAFNFKTNAQDLTKKIDSSSRMNPVKNDKNTRKKSDKNKLFSNKVSTMEADLSNASRKDPIEVVNFEKSLSSSENLLDKKTSEDKIETAFDFVKKLNRTKLLPDNIKKEFTKKKFLGNLQTFKKYSSGISAKKEKKLDSKGFRILKHQVPSLEYFTRDEMLELLKGSILYTDEDIVVLNKPYNLVMHESSTSQNLACLSRYLDDLAKLLDCNTNAPKLITVHRLDKETTGCLLLARNEVSAARLKSLFAQRKISKTYWIVTTKVPDPMEGVIDIPISEGKIEKRSRMVLHPKLPDDTPYVSHSKPGKQAITQYSVIAESGNAALVEVKPETGIKHQIRVHFGFGLGCPILGDHKYSHLDKLVPQKLPSDLLQRLHVRQSKVRHIPLHIHAKHVSIPQYLNDRHLFVTAPLPRHMSENLQFLKFKKRK